MKKVATFSHCRKYRYELWRYLSGPFMPGYVMFIGLNPSTADEVKDDQTIRRCVGYARDWGYSRMCMTNLFAYRATLPNDMKAVDDPVGPANDITLVELAKGAGVVVAAWGVHGAYLDRAEEVMHLIPRQLSYLRLTKDGFPGHPLRLPKNLRPTLWLV